MNGLVSIKMDDGLFPPDAEALIRLLEAEMFLTELVGRLPGQEKFLCGVIQFKDVLA